MKVSVARPSLGKVQFGQNAFQGLAFGPKPFSKFPPVSTKRKLESTEIVEDDIACFKRVRLVTSKERVKFIPGPFHQEQISGNDLSVEVASRYTLEESKVWEDFREKKLKLGSSHSDTLASLGSLIRTLRNVGKSSIAEELLVDTLKVEEMTLVDYNPKLLRMLMGSLMAALADQKKLEAAEELWSRATALFLSKLSKEEHDALVRVFELAHPFRIASSPQSVGFGAIQETREGNGNGELPERSTSPFIEWQDSAQPHLFSKSQSERESFIKLLSNFVPVSEPTNKVVTEQIWDANWDTETGAAVQILKGHSGQVWSVAFSPDSKQVISGSDDGTVRLWDTETGAALQILKGHLSTVSSVAFLPDGKQVVSGSYDRTVRLWDAETGAALWTLKGHSDWVSSVAFSPNGKQVVSGSYDQTVRLWDAETGAALWTLKGHSGSVSLVAFSPNGDQVVSGSYDRTVRFWDTKTGRALQTLKGHSDWVSSVAFSPNSSQVVSGSHDRTIQIWGARMKVVL
jgi:hypothetical protein